MNSNQIYVRRGLYILASMVFLSGIYILFMTPGPTSSTLVEGDKNKEHSCLVKLDLPSSPVSGTVLSVTGQLVAVQGIIPHTISLVYVNTALPEGLVPGNTVNVNGEFKKDPIFTDNITITGEILRAAPFTAPQSLGLIDHVIFFIVYILLWWHSNLLEYLDFTSLMFSIEIETFSKIKFLLLFLGLLESFLLVQLLSDIDFFHMIGIKVTGTKIILSKLIASPHSRKGGNTV